MLTDLDNNGQQDETSGDHIGKLLDSGQTEQ